MNECDLTEKVSALLDGELAPGEFEQVKLHLAACPICREAQRGFLDTRARIRSYESIPDETSRRGTLDAILGRPRVPPWRRAIRVPVPLAAMLALLIVGLLVWILFSGGARPMPGVDPIRAVVKKPVNERDADGKASDLARYDRGDRTVIYKEQRSDIDTPSER